ncbi:MAG TPA: hypothetical protein VIY86_08090 [Pirellulaceae bacterium]
MNRGSAFRRKILYLAAIAVLFVPISYLSAPATTRSEGGVLSQMRKEERLSPAQLGKIDPASASMSLATLGMRGVAANLLWGRAHHFQMTENFDGLMSTLAQIAKLQPNFVAVWQHQAWNVSYNASVEFDDYRHRYAWVKKGLDFLIEGTTYNRDEPLLLWDGGWFFGHKLGRADEYLQFRRLFRGDTDFHRKLPFMNSRERPNLLDVNGPDQLPDNWRVAHNWFRVAEQAVASGASLTRLATHYVERDRNVVGKKQTPLRGKNPLIFYSDPPKALINYADAIEKDGYLDEISLVAWRKAGQAWDEYGNLPILSTYGVPIRLNELEQRQERLIKSSRELARLLPGVLETILKERQEALSQEEKDLMARPLEDLAADEQQVLFAANAKLEVRPSDVAARAPAEIRDQAIRLARGMEEDRQQIEIITSYRDIVNFMNWKQRCQAEQEPNTLQARKKVYDAEKAFDASDLESSRRLFEEGWQHWATMFEKYPIFIDDVEGEIVAESIVKYKRLLDQLNEPFPPPGFPLMKLLESHAQEFPEIAPPQENGTSTSTTPPPVDPPST